MAAKATTFLDEINENFLLCSVCSQRYQNAKLLPCLHTFCEPCLVKLAGGGRSLTCPVCRRSHQLPADGAAGLDNNPFLNDLVDLFKKRGDKQDDLAKCEGCKQGDQVKHCVECAIAICSICEASHKVLPLTKSHRLISLDEYLSAKSSDPASVQPPVYCSKHPNYEIEFYCDTCDAAICLMCTVLDHPMTQHKYRCVKDAAKDYTKDLTAMIDKVKTKETEANDSKTAVTFTLQSLDTCFKKETNQLKDHTQKTIKETTRLITEDDDKLQTEMKAEYDSRKVNLNAQLKELEIMQYDLSNAREYAEKLMNYGNAAHLMSAKVGISTKVKQLLKEESKCEPRESDYMEFKPSGDFCKTKTLGIIQTAMTSVTLKCVSKTQTDDEDNTVATATGDTRAHGSASTDAVKSAYASKEVESVEGVTESRNGRTTTLKTPAKMEGGQKLSASVSKKPVQGSPVKSKPVPKKGLVCKFGEKGRGAGQLQGTFGVTLTRTGDALVSDFDNHRLQSFSVGGKHQKIFQFGNLGNAFEPKDAAVSVDGNIFTTDGGNKQVIVCDENGKLIRCFGKGKIKHPIGIGISPVNGRVYVVDNSAHCIHIYDQDGNHIKSFGSKGSKGGEFSYPWFVCIDDKGNVYVSDTGNHRIQVFDSDGHFLYTFGSEGRGDGQLFHSRGVAVDKHGYVYVSDKGNNRIVKYESGGKFVCRIDRDEDGLNAPFGICVTGDEPLCKVLVADYGNHCVKVFAQ